MQAVLAQPGLPPPSADLGLPMVPAQSVILHEGGVPVQVITVSGENDTPVQAVVTKGSAAAASSQALLAYTPMAAVPTSMVTMHDGTQAQAVTVMGEDGNPMLALVSAAVAPWASGALMANEHWGPASSMAALPTGSMALPLSVTSVPAETLSDPAGNPLEGITIINEGGAPMQAVLAQPGLPPPSADLGLPVVRAQSVILHDGGVPVQVITVLGENDTPVQAVVLKDGAPLQAPIQSMTQLPTGAQQAQSSYNQPTGLTLLEKRSVMCSACGSDEMKVVGCDCHFNLCGLCWLPRSDRQVENCPRCNLPLTVPEMSDILERVLRRNKEYKTQVATLENTVQALRSTTSPTPLYDQLLQANPSVPWRPL